MSDQEWTLRPIISGVDRNHVTPQWDKGATLGMLEEIAQAGQASIHSTLLLRRYAVSDIGPVQGAAVTALSTLADVIGQPPQQHRPDSRPSFVAFRSLNDVLLAARHPFGVLATADRRVRQAWTWVGLTLTIAAAVELALQNWALSLGLLASRLMISLAFGNTYNLPFEGTHLRGETGLTLVSRCMAGHSADTVLLLAAGFALSSSHRPLWGLACYATATAMLLATLARVAALQVGQQLFRLQVERVTRNSAGLCALALAAFVQTEVPRQGMPLLALAAVGPLLYAVVEASRTWIRLRDEPQDGRGGERVQIVVHAAGGPQQLRTGDAVGDGPLRSVAGF